MDRTSVDRPVEDMMNNMNEAKAIQAVTVDTYIRAESDHYFLDKANAGAFGKWLHLRQPPSLDKQLVIRMNRDTLYSYAVLDLSEPAIIVMPDSGDRFQSMVVLNEDQYIKLVTYEPGEYELTQSQFDTRYVHVAVRTFADPGDPTDLKTAHALQDSLQIRQRDPGKLELPDWDQAQRSALRTAILALIPVRKVLTSQVGAGICALVRLLPTAARCAARSEDSSGLS